MLFTAVPGSCSVCYYPAVFWAFLPSLSVCLYFHALPHLGSLWTVRILPALFLTVKSYIEQGMHKICKSRLLLLPSPFKIAFLFSGRYSLFSNSIVLSSLVLLQEKQQQRADAGVTFGFSPDHFPFRKLTAHWKGEVQKDAISCLGLYRTLVTAQCCSGSQ